MITLDRRNNNSPTVELRLCERNANGQKTGRMLTTVKTDAENSEHIAVRRITKPIIGASAARKALVNAGFDVD